MTTFIGIDWSEQKHDVIFMNGHGDAVLYLVVPHSADGFMEFEQKRHALGLRPDDCVVGLETAHNLLIDHLWSYEYREVFVIPPNVVKSTRGRYGQTGARTDKSDALLLADLLRTDRARLHPWKPDQLLTRQMRATVNRIHYHTRQIVSLSNRLRAVLLRYYPAALTVFSSHRQRIALAFLQAYPTPQAASQLTYAEFEAFAKQHHYRRPKLLPACYKRLQASHPQTRTDTAQVYYQEAKQLAELLETLLDVKSQALKDLNALFCQHPDHDIFASLPGCGEFLAPALLTKFGDDRQRFPAPQHIQALAGTCPVTEMSGKRRIIRFRRACDKDFRHFTQQWARTSLGQSAWATSYWDRIRSNCASTQHAYRCLANRWLAVAWKLWQDRLCYDEAFHLQQSLKHRRPRQQ